MKSILLFRHGEADSGFNYNSDHERPLTLLGISEAEKVGTYLANINKIPDLVISSSANRANTTANKAIKAGKWKCDKIIEKGIYGGGPDYLLNLAKSQNDKYNFIAFVGHEPNFSIFIEKAASMNYVSFPTAAAACISFDIDTWNHIEFGFGELDFLTTPKELDSKYI